MGRKKIIIAGGKGQLGCELFKMLTTKECEFDSLPKFYDDVEVLSYGSFEFNITNKEAVLKKLEEEKPYAVVNCAAYTDVDGCEDNKEKAFCVNSLGPLNLAIACEKFGVKLVHISTDYVFDGEDKNAKIEYDVVNPKSVYGKSKALGEEYVRNFCTSWFILRTSWLYGEFGKNFVKTIVKAAGERDCLKVVCDQFGSPTNVHDLSLAIAKVLTTQNYGIYHAAGKGECSWYDFAVKIAKSFELEVKIEPCSTEEFKRKAKRPAYSKLENFMLKLTVGECFRDWEKAIEFFAKKMKGKI